ncbi:MAG: hypothetical protein ABI759_20010 [Candidatus Solibacter sp.]
MPPTPEKETKSQEPPAARASTLDSLKHPILILLIGSAMSAFVVPWLSARINDRRLLEEARLQQCRNILASGSETDRKLNTLLVTMEMFVKDNASLPAIPEQERAHMRTELSQLYRDFDSQAWWWFSRLSTENKLLRIDYNSQALSAITQRYQDNVIAATNAIDKLWTLCVRKTVKPSDPILRDTATASRTELSRLQLERQSLIGQLVYLFAPKEPTIQRLLTQP